jgi:hypothetical protein
VRESVQLAGCVRCLGARSRGHCGPAGLRRRFRAFAG